VARILLLALGALIALYFLKKFKRLDAAARRRIGRETVFLVGAVVAVLVFARFGLHWLGLVVAGGWALLRGVAPFALRLLPLLQRNRAQGKQEQRRETPSGNSSSSGPDARANGNTKSKELMSRAEALEVLGVNEGASREVILAAYRSLIRKVHPDSPGGSNYLASKLNQAKDVLLD
jgi:hypothetical protein